MRLLPRRTPLLLEGRLPQTQILPRAISRHATTALLTRRRRPCLRNAPPLLRRRLLLQTLSPLVPTVQIRSGDLLPGDIDLSHSMVFSRSVCERAMEVFEFTRGCERSLVPSW